MSDPIIQRQLDESYAKLQALQGSLANTAIPTNVVPIVAPVVASALAPIAQEVAPQATIDSVEALISKLIEERLAGLLANTTLPEPVKEITILDALGNILTGAELKWLQDAKVISRIPEYVLTEEGQDLTQKFFRSFRKDYEK
jgi:hypothetical protein